MCEWKIGFFRPLKMSEGTYPYGFGGAFATLGRGEAARLFGVDGLLQRILLAKKQVELDI